MAGPVLAYGRNGEPDSISERKISIGVGSCARCFWGHVQLLDKLDFERGARHNAPAKPPSWRVPGFPNMRPAPVGRPSRAISMLIYGSKMVSFLTLKRFPLCLMRLDRRPRFRNCRSWVSRDASKEVSKLRENVPCLDSLEMSPAFWGDTEASYPHFHRPAEPLSR